MLQRFKHLLRVIGHVDDIIAVYLLNYPNVVLRLKIRQLEAVKAGLAHLNNYLRIESYA